MADNSRFLAVVRCGDNSCHSSWSAGERNFDLAVSYYGNDATKTFPEAAYVHRKKGGKWDGLWSFFQTFPEVIRKYEYFWLPDDDIVASVDAINRLFLIGAEKNLHLFQPSLDDQSYYSHIITLKHPSFWIRYTNFVEIMVPVLSNAMLRQTLPTFKDTLSGFGMDFVWPRLAANLSTEPASCTAIIDAVSVCHSRPVGGNLHNELRNVAGKTAMDEWAYYSPHNKRWGGASINGMPVPRIRIIAGCRSDGRLVRGVGLAADVYRDLIKGPRNRVQPFTKFAAIKHAMKSLSG